MRAVNLIPAEERRGGGAIGGRSGGAAYVLLGLLGVLAIVMTLHTLAKRSVTEQQAELTRVEAQATMSEARAAELSSYVEFAGLREARTTTVISLAASRFDWSHALAEIARVIPKDVTLTGLQATVAPGVAVKASAAVGTGSLRGALPVPAIELAGCTTSQEAVARMLTRMRLIDGVTRVSLKGSAKAAQKGASDSACQRGKDSPQFALVVFLDQVAGAVPTKAAGAGRISAAQFTPSGPTGATGATGATAAPAGGTP